MKIYDIQTSEGKIAAFEVDNLLIGRRGACRIVESIPGAKVQKHPALFSWLREHVFCQFALEDQLFEIGEPFGDNSRYWIGPVGVGQDGNELKYVPEIDLVRTTFEQA